MPETVSAAAPSLSRPLLLIAASVGILMAGTVALWLHYGTAVFDGCRFYATVSGKRALFRLTEHLARFEAAARCSWSAASTKSSKRG